MQMVLDTDSTDLCNDFYSNYTLAAEVQENLCDSATFSFEDPFLTCYALTTI